MTFLHGTLLAGAAVIAIPIVLHLIMRQKPKHLPFPALRFLQQRQQSHRRSLRWQHLLLLALRCAILAVLAMALARPTLTASGFLADRAAPLAAAMVFDTAPRMDCRANDQTRLQVAEEWARGLLDDIPHESDIAVIDTPSLAAAFSVDVGAARDRIGRLTTQSLTRPLSDLVAASAKLLASSDKRRKEIYVFTDLSQSAWPSGSESAEKLVPESSGIVVHVMDVGAPSASNLGISSFRLSQDVVNVARTQNFRVQIRSQGSPSDRLLQIWLTDAVGHKTLKGERAIPAAAGVQELEFPAPHLSQGFHQGELRFTGEDSLAADDVAYFSVIAAPPWKVLIAAPKAEKRSPDEAAFFVHEALAPLPLRKRDAAPFVCTISSPAELLANDLNMYDAVLLVDPAPLPDEAWRKLNAYAAAGHGIGVILGPSALPMDSFNEAAAQGVLPGTLLRQFRTGEEGTFLRPSPNVHPILNRFRQYSEVPWSEGSVWRFWQIHPADDAYVIMDFANGQPALIEKGIGRGRSVTVTTDLSNNTDARARWNLLPLVWPCPMLIEETVAHLCGRGQQRLNYDVGQTAILSMAGVDVGNLAVVTTPDGDTLRNPISDADKTVLVTATQTPGNYQVAAGGKDRGVRTGFSVNLSADACDLTRISDQQLAEAFGHAHWKVSCSRAEFEKSLATEAAGVELYPYLMVLLLILLLCEQVAANRFYGAAAESGASGAQRWAKLWGRDSTSKDAASPTEVGAS